MKKTLLKTLMLVALLVVSIATYAVPADPRPITVKQPNGKTLTFYLKGDERMHWAETLDGYTLLENAQGNLVYAVIDAQGDMVASTRLAANVEERTSADTRFLANVQKKISYSATQKQVYHKLWESKVSTKAYSQGTFPPKGKMNLLVVLVNFSDLAFTTDKSVFENMCMQENYNGYGSIHDYYYTTSGGQLDLQIKVVGPITLENSMSYYGADGTYTYEGKTYTQHDKNVREMVTDAIAIVKDSVNLADYDNDGDGIIDDVAFIYAGTPQSTTKNADEIWPHSGRAQGTTIYNGVKVNRYTCSAEKPDQVIGTFCHEFGHALGLPDEYDTDYDDNGGTSVTVGTYSLMCEGSYNNNQNTPPLWSAAQKICTGWIDSVVTLDATKDSIRLPLLTGTNDTAYRSDIYGTYEFFIVEYRKKQGFDSFIPGQGLIIYHGQMNKINAWLNEGKNSINVKPSDRGWFIEPANGLLSGINTANAPFPGAKNVTNFLNPTLVNGTAIDNVKITDIHYLNDSVMMFNFNSSLPVIVTNNASKKTASSLTVSANVSYKHDDMTITKKGIVYSTDTICPYVAENVIEDTTLSDEVNINAVIEGLTNSTTYYYKGFIVDQDNNMYFGSVNHSMTSSGLGYVVTANPTNIDSTGATMKGSLESVGQGTFVEKGFVYVLDSSEIMPTLEDTENCVKVVVPGEDNGAYEYDLTGLQQGVTCYYRAFITNSYGTYYDYKKSFQTLYPEIKNNTISANQQICSNTVPAELTGEEPTGGFGNFTYLWQQQVGYSAWSNAEGTNDGVNYQPPALTSTTKYRRIAASDGKFTSTSNTITVEVISSKAGTITSSKNVYSVGETFTLTLKSYTGSVVEWLTGTTSNNLTSIGNAGSASIEQMFEEKGTHYYQVKVQNGTCEAALTDVKSITIDNSSIDEAQNGSVFEIMPNPAPNGTFTINADIDNVQSLIITNALGQVVYSEKDVNLHNKTITLHNAENGSYFINVIADNKLMTGKLIINK